MQNNTVNATGDFCAVCGRSCTGHGVVDCVGVVFGVVVTPTAVLSRGCLVTGQRRCIAIVVEWIMWKLRTRG